MDNKMYLEIVIANVEQDRRKTLDKISRYEDSAYCLKDYVRYQEEKLLEYKTKLDALGAGNAHNASVSSLTT